MNAKLDPAILASFIGSTQYWRINRRCVITDGAKYLADAAGAYWLIDAAASYLIELGNADWFVLIRLRVCERTALLSFEDGSGQLYASQSIPWRDIPLAEQLLYAGWDGSQWVLMLPSEY